MLFRIGLYYFNIHTVPSFIKIGRKTRKIKVFCNKYKLADTVSGKQNVFGKKLFLVLF